MKLIKLATVRGRSFRSVLAAPLNLGKADLFLGGQANISQQRPRQAKSADHTQAPVAEI